MNQENAVVGFIGAGGIARSHAFAINSLRYLYNDYPEVELAAIKRIYLEKPVCSNHDEEIALVELISKHPGVKIQVGFQYLFIAAVREALSFWKSGKFGLPIHFELKYYHSDYLQRE